MQNSPRDLTETPDMMPHTQARLVRAVQMVGEQVAVSIFTVDLMSVPAPPLIVRVSGR